LLHHPMASIWKGRCKSGRRSQKMLPLLNIQWRKKQITLRDFLESEPASLYTGAEKKKRKQVAKKGQPIGKRKKGN